MGLEHYNVARQVQQTLQRYRDLQDIIAILGVEELSEDDKLAVSRARKMQRFLTQPMFVAAQFTGRDGRYVKIADTVRGFREILDGKYDDLPEQAFYMVGDDRRSSRERGEVARIRKWARGVERVARKCGIQSPLATRHSPLLTKEPDKGHESRHCHARPLAVQR